MSNLRAMDPEIKRRLIRHLEDARSYYVTRLFLTKLDPKTYSDVKAAWQDVILLLKELKPEVTHDADRPAQG